MALTKGIVSGGNYTFSAANRTITFSSDYIGMSLSDVTYITNIKSGVATVIYDPFDATKGGVLNGLVLTLAYNTTSMGDTDPLQIIVGFTPLNSDPTPVRIVEGPDDKDDTELLNRIADGIDYLNLSLDQTEGVQINTRDVSIKKDIQGAIISSDAPDDVRSRIFRAVNDSFIIDTTGYNTTIYTIYTTVNASLNVQPETSADGNIWFPIPYTLSSTSAAANYIPANSPTFVGVGNSYMMTCNSAGKFVRLRVASFTAGSCTVICQLRNTVYGVHSPIGAPQSLVSIGASAPVNSTAVLSNASTTSLSGTLTVGAGWAPTTNAPNAFSTLATSIPHPFSIGGREQPYIGALGGIFRHITVDGGGRYILGGDTPDTETRFQSRRGDGSISGLPPRGVGAIPNNMVGAQSLTVADVSQDFGDTHIMLLRQILTELKILNQQFVEMPQMLNQANFTMSDPQEYRNDGDFDSSIQ